MSAFKQQSDLKFNNLKGVCTRKAVRTECYQHDSYDFGTDGT